MFGELREKDRVEGDLKRIEHHYKRYQEAGNKNALFKSTFRAFAGAVCLQMSLGLLQSILSFAAPYLVLKMTEFIKEGEPGTELTWEEVKPGVIYAAALCFSQMLAYCISEHMSYLNVLTGRRSSNAVIAFIY